MYLFVLFHGLDFSKMFSQFSVQMRHLDQCAVNCINNRTKIQRPKIVLFCRNCDIKFDLISVCFSPLPTILAEKTFNSSSSFCSLQLQLLRNCKAKNVFRKLLQKFSSSPPLKLQTPLAEFFYESHFENYADSYLQMSSLTSWQILLNKNSISQSYRAIGEG